MADGGVYSFNVYSATVIWDGQSRVVEALEANSPPLLGMQMMDGHILRIEVSNGGQVEISATP
jgi:predicted aspartyl protease